MTHPPEGTSPGSPPQNGGSQYPGYSPPPGYSAPPGYPQPSGYTPPGPAQPLPWGQSVQQSRNGLGLAALILGIVGIALAFLAIGIFPAILAIIFGIIGINRVRRGVATNRGQALAGLILGIVGFVIAAIFISVIAVRAVDCSNKYDTGTDAFNNCLQNKAR
jgi:Domain of unknown function (DUF4190)